MQLSWASRSSPSPRWAWGCCRCDAPSPPTCARAQSFITFAFTTALPDPPPARAAHRACQVPHARAEAGGRRGRVGAARDPRTAQVMTRAPGLFQLLHADPSPPPPPPTSFAPQRPCTSCTPRSIPTLLSCDAARSARGRHQSVATQRARVCADPEQSFIRQQKQRRRGRESGEGAEGKRNEQGRACVHEHARRHPTQTRAR